MMSNYTQEDRPLKITTLLGEDVLLIYGFRAHEEISRLFDFEVSLIADLNKEVRFDSIVGESVTVKMRLIDGSFRYFNGIVNRFSQGRRDESHRIRQQPRRRSCIARLRESLLRLELGPGGEGIQKSLGSWS